MLHLKISDDGKAIVDDQGKTIVTFVEGMQVKMATTEKFTTAEATSIPGCMCCEKECIAYDSTSGCIKTYKSCTWDFDCACKKDK